MFNVAIPQLAPVYRVNPDVANAIRELKLQSIEVDRRKTFMKYQFDHFRMVSTGMLSKCLAFLVALCRYSCPADPVSLMY